MHKLALLVCTMLMMLAVTGAAPAADKPVDRVQWHDADASVSDDLRKVTVPKGFGRPKGAIVITHARLFDGTGAAARPAAILIVDGLIAKLAADASTLGAPADARSIDAAARL